MKRTHVLFFIVISLISFECFGQQSLVPYAGEYRAGVLRYKQIYKPSDYDDPSTYPIKKIDYQIVIDPNARLIKYKNNDKPEQWDHFKIIGNPRFERYLDDKGDEVLMTKSFKSRDNYGEYCEIGLAFYKSSGSFRLVINYPNKTYYSYEFVPAQDWDKYSH